MHCFNACSLSCSLLHCLRSIISIFLMVTNCQWVKLWNHQYVESPAFIFVHSRVTMGDSFLNTVARISTCGQQLFLRREDGLYMKLSLKLVLDRKQKKECGIQFCRKVRKPTTTRNHSAGPVCTLLWRPTWHQKEPWDNLKQVNSPLYFWFVRPQPPASGWSADWGTAGSPAAAAVQHHWEENT